MRFGNWVLCAVVKLTSRARVNESLGVQPPANQATADSVRQCFEQAINSGCVAEAVRQRSIAHFAQFAVQLVRYSRSDECLRALGPATVKVLSSPSSGATITVVVNHICKTLKKKAADMAAALRESYGKINELTMVRVYLLGEALLCGEKRGGSVGSTRLLPNLTAVPVFMQM